MSVTGANLNSLHDIQRVAATTGELAITTASQTRQATEQVREQVTDVATSISTQFDQTLTQLTTVANQADTQVNTAGWTGNAREQAVAAAADFRAEVSRLDTNTRTGLQQFTTELNRRTDELNNGLSTQFSNLMTETQQTFEQFAARVARFSRDLHAVDHSVHRV